MAESPVEETPGAGNMVSITGSTEVGWMEGGMEGEKEGGREREREMEGGKEEGGKEEGERKIGDEIRRQK